MALIECKNISFIVENNENRNYILNDLNISVEDGDFLIILGKSGSGKTTLLNIMVGLIKPTSGIVEIDGHNLIEMSDDEKTYWRRFYMGYIFQNYGLFETLNVFDNIYLSLDLNYQISFKAKKYFKDYVRSKKPSYSEVDQIMKKLRIDHLKNKFPHELSGGQQQRVSLARILVKKPKIIFGDEPTGALDYETSNDVMDMILQLNILGSTIVLITHNENLVKYANKIVKISDGRIVSLSHNDNSAEKERIANASKIYDKYNELDNVDLWGFVFDYYSKCLAITNYNYWGIKND